MREQREQRDLPDVVDLPAMFGPVIKAIWGKAAGILRRAASPPGLASAFAVRS